MNILNKREVFLTWRTEDLYRIEDCLAANNIKYKVIRIGRFTRAAGISAEAADEHHVYVLKADFERAKRAIENR